MGNIFSFIYTLFYNDTNQVEQSVIDYHINYFKLKDELKYEQMEYRLKLQNEYNERQKKAQRESMLTKEQYEYYNGMDILNYTQL